MTVPAIPEIPRLPVDAALPRRRVVAGRRLAALPADGTGILAAWAHPRRLMAGLDVSLPRERETPDERIFVPLDLPAVVVEWRVSRPVDLRLRWECGPTGGDPPPEREGPTLVVRKDDAASLFHLDPEPVEWLVQPSPTAGGGPVRCEATVWVRPGEPCRLVALSADAGDPGFEAHLARLRHLGAEVVRRDEADARLSRELLSVEAEGDGGDDVSRGVEEAKHRVESALVGSGTSRLVVGGFPERGPSPRYEAETALEIGTGLLAAGDVDAVADVLGTLLDAGDGAGLLPGAWLPGSRPAPGTPEATAAVLRLVARHVLWSGDLSLVTRHREALDAAVRALAADGSSGDHPAVRGALADAVEPVGDEEWTARIRNGIDPGPHPAFSGIETPPPGSLPPPLSGAASPGEAGAFLAAIAYGLLGLRPDAAYGRLRLAPALPTGWTRARAAGIRCGDATIAVGYRREGSRHTFSLEPTGGSLPVTLAFEPSVPATGVAAAAVDGDPADLEAATREGRTRVQVQLALDHERTVTVDGR